MPSKYDPGKALPLRVPPELRERLDAVTALVPERLRLPRNSVAVAALARGLEQLAAELARDPMAAHRALAGEPPAPAAAPRVAAAAPPPSTGAADVAPAPRPPPSAAAPLRPRPPQEQPADGAELRERWKASGLGVRPFCARYSVARSAFQAWLAGRQAMPSTLAKIAAGLDAEGK